MHFVVGSLILIDIALVTVAVPLPALQPLVRDIIDVLPSQSAVSEVAPSSTIVSASIAAVTNVAAVSAAPVTFGDLIAPSTGGTFDDFLADPREANEAGSAASVEARSIATTKVTKTKARTKVVSRAGPNAGPPGKQAQRPPAKSGKAGAAQPANVKTPAGGQGSKPASPANVVPPKDGKGNNSSKSGGNGNAAAPPPAPPAPQGAPPPPPPPPGPDNKFSFNPFLRKPEGGPFGAFGGGDPF